MFQLKYLIIDFHVLHFRIFKVLQVGFFFKSFYKHNILGFFFQFWTDSSERFAYSFMYSNTQFCTKKPVYNNI